jgi:hypothetical protein
LLHHAELPQLADEAARELPDRMSAEQLEAWEMHHGISHDDLISSFGGGSKHLGQAGAAEARPDPERLQSLSDPTPGVALASGGVILRPSGPESGPAGQSRGPDNGALPQLIAPYRQFRRVGRVGLEPTTGGL